MHECVRILSEDRLSLVSAMLASLSRERLATATDMMKAIDRYLEQEQLAERAETATAVSAPQPDYWLIYSSCSEAHNLSFEYLMVNACDLVDAVGLGYVAKVSYPAMTC
jgi:hypothetical protein